MCLHSLVCAAHRNAAFEHVPLTIRHASAALFSSGFWVYAGILLTAVDVLQGMPDLTEGSAEDDDGADDWLDDDEEVRETTCHYEC
jgi:hypothetical protein